jgi:Lar family restriction alleviation protein
MKSKELKPCPFCGGNAEIRMFINDGEKRYYTACFNDTCAIRPHSITTFKTQKKAIAAWNTRAERS